MARFDTGGIAATMARFDAVARGADAAISKAVKAGGNLLAERLGEAAPYRYGDLSRSLEAGKVEWSAGDGFHCTVRPEGDDKRGEPFAKIGNILEYGRSNMPPRPWFQPTVDASADEVIGVMADTFHAEQAKAGGG